MGNNVFLRHCCPLNDRVEFELISYSSPELEAKVFGMSKDVKKMPVFELQGGVGHSGALEAS